MMENTDLMSKKIGFCITGSFCTIERVLNEIEKLVKSGADVTAIISDSVDNLDTRFFKSEELKNKIRDITGKPILKGITNVEPIGPKKLFDILIIAPCTGNTISKIALGITDTAVVMAAKSHLRNLKPVVLGVSTNDGLGNSAKNIGILLNTKQIYFVPFGQDDPQGKERSLVLNAGLIIPTIIMALCGKQIQPILCA